MTNKRRIGVYVCHCGGNISDYVDVKGVAETLATESEVEVTGTHLFACSDASQQEMIDEIKEKKLDGLVIASCSPKLHMFTFRAMAERAGLNPYQYVHVNLREQCSWVHTNDKASATEKGINIVRAGVAKCALTHPLTPIRIETQPRVLVVGAGVAGMRAAISLAGMGLSVFIIERESEPGGWVTQVGWMGPYNRQGSEVVADLLEQIRKHENIILYTNAELTAKSGHIGDFTVTVRLRGKEDISINVGAIVVATGFTPYEPRDGEYGWGLPGVVTLKDFRQMLEAGDGPLTYKGVRVRDVAFIYCVGSRQTESETYPEPNTHCSRYCCMATAFSGSLLHQFEKKSGQTINQYHLYRDVRTYGHLETVYSNARADGALFLRWDPKDPPLVGQRDGRLAIKVKDTLVGDKELEIGADLVVLATGMTPRENDSLNDVLKLPKSKDGFYNEIHIKLRPVETVIDGVCIAGTAQGPKNLAESVASALAAVARTGALLKKGYMNLEPLVAKIDTNKCVWCGECVKACPYSAIERVLCDDKEVATVIESSCKGEGACVPICPQDALVIEGYRDDQIVAMIDASLKEAVPA
ncbi:MAG: CoB--CoM heterodisulfide reductase iron-sulfur subunit A family protein [Alphaproteobacteria bacterium]|nr:CoB--CoM heterodisulfide reductase iron-sulfur subunit A family protein [Alphaproteobacteria bacterium]MDE2495938.1 CoB--CoM heterodisulfide reductase iron-sulfur subunit A family protein [Alphaproteobacteria bacterium]